jgi:hypothetical protein
MLKEQGVRVELYSSVSGYRPVVGCCEHGNEPAGFIKVGEFLELLRNCQLLKNDFPIVVSCLVLRRVLIQILARRLATLTEVLRDFPYLFQANAEKYPKLCQSLSPYILKLIILYVVRRYLV